MLRLFLVILCFLFSLLTVVPIPARQLWYAAIAIAEFPLIWLTLISILLLWTYRAKKYRTFSFVMGIIAFLLFLRPVIGAYIIGASLDERLEKSFSIRKGTLDGFHMDHPFSFWHMLTLNGNHKIPYTTHQYAPGDSLHSLRFYPAQRSGVRPCLLVVHGGSWKSGNFGELPDVDNYFANAGYNVATINYRLAPQYKSPAPQEDVQAALAWLRQHGQWLNIDTTRFVLLGRSAGGQIVLTAAYSLHDPSIKGVISFYGPTDMVFGYNDPHNKLVMDHHKVMQDFFGGTPADLPQAYVDASPVHYVTPATVPTLLIHGQLDQHVHHTESVLLSQKLDSAHVPNMLLSFPWATHGCEYSLNGPSGQLAAYTMERFLLAVTR